jgi:energy-converting hydrogenase A subunit R
LQKFADANEQPLAKWVVVGSSLTNIPLLQTVDAAGGLAIAFNANEYALSSATMSLASTFIGDLLEILPAWAKGQRKGIEAVVKMKEKTGGKENRGYFHWLSGRKDISEVIEIHKRIRRLVKEEAEKAG